MFAQFKAVMSTVRGHQVNYLYMHLMGGDGTQFGTRENASGIPW